MANVTSHAGEPADADRQLDSVVQEFRREDPLERVTKIRNGLPYDELERLQSVMALSAAETAKVLGIPERTLARRKNRKLTPDESDRLDRVLRVVELGTHVLGDEAKLRGWLHAPNRALGGLVPLELLDTDRGVRAVEDVLLRIEHGSYG